MKNYKKGQILLLTSGEYSDFGVSGLYKVSRDFTTEELQEAYLSRELTERETEEYDRRSSYQFDNWMKKSGYVKEMDYEEMHFGCYGRLELP